MEQLLENSEASSLEESCNFHNTIETDYYKDITCVSDVQYDCYNQNTLEENSSSSNSIADESMQSGFALNAAVQFLNDNQLTSYNEIVNDDVVFQTIKSEFKDTTNCERALDIAGGEIKIKVEAHQQNDATEDESMAVEALRQLGGMINTKGNAKMGQIHCEVCRTNFQSEEELQNHDENCGLRETFGRKYDLENHEDGHQLNRQHSCRICGCLFKKKMELQTHMLCHTSGRSHRCKVCNADFQRPSSLTNHMKVHNYLPGRAIIFNQNPKIEEPELSEQWAPFLNTPDSNANLFNQNLPPLNTITTLSGWSNPFGFSGDGDMGGVANIAQEINVNTSTYEETHLTNNFDNFTNEMCENNRNTENYTKLNDYNDVKLEIPFLRDVESITGFTSVSGLAEVAVNLNEKRPHICTLCGLAFSRVKALISHERLHQTSWGGSVECETCEELFPDEVTLTEHSLTCSIIEVPPANVVAVPLKIQKNSIAAINQLGKLDEINCNSKVSGGITDVLKLKEGQSTNKTGKILAKPLKQHSCPECPKKFVTKQKMFRHMWIHRKKTFTCEICAQTFAQQPELDEHRLSRHPGDSPYLCGECGKCFASRQGLWEHGRVHGGGTAGLFNCAECGKQFASRQGYLIHTRTHTGERPYGCRYCWKAFRDGGTLRKHERIHTGERPHACPLCPRAFNQKVVLREHVRWVHAANKTENIEAPFTCQLCNQTLGDREELCAHIVKHSDQIAAIAKEASTKNVPAAPGPLQPTNKSTGATMRVKKPLRRRKDKIMTNKTQISVKLKHDLKMTMNKSISGPGPGPPAYGERSSSVSAILNQFSCDLCGDHFSTRELLRSHVKIHI